MQSEKKGVSIKKLIFRFVLIIFITLPLLSIFWWYTFRPEKKLNLLILDKTVLNKKGNEHRSFNWILKNRKYTKPNGEFYNIAQDYKGYFPLDSFYYFIDDLDQYSNNQLDSMTWDLDLVYFTDCYGIYQRGWHSEEEALEHSPLIYGGMKKNDLDVLRFMKEKDKLILTEFNMIAHPTPYGVRRAFEKEFNMKWTGWTGRYFGSLDTNINPEIPPWVIDMYKKQYRQGWPFRKAGIVFVHELEIIVILEAENDLFHEIPVINTPPLTAERLNVAPYMRYPFWFDIIFPKNEEEILATYRIYPNERGDSLLRFFGIPKEFPAVIGYPDKHRFYYFAGDFADNPISMWAVRAAGIEYLDFFLYNNQELTDRRKFFWRYYVPMVSTILSEYYEEMKTKDLLYAY